MAASGSPSPRFYCRATRSDVHRGHSPSAQGNLKFDTIRIFLYSKSSVLDALLCMSSIARWLGPWCKSALWRCVQLLQMWDHLSRYTARCRMWHCLIATESRRFVDWLPMKQLALGEETLGADAIVILSLQEVLRCWTHLGMLRLCWSCQ